MEEPRHEELLLRIAQLEKEKKRWKLIGLGALAMLGVAMVLGGILCTATFVVTQRQLVMSRQEAMIQRDQAEISRHEAEQARRLSEQVR